MAIPQKMASTVTINATDAKFTEYKSIKVELRQGNLCLSYVPAVVSDTQISFTILADDAAQFSTKRIQWQVICKDANGDNIYTTIKMAYVDEILGGKW